MVSGQEMPRDPKRAQEPFHEHQGIEHYQRAEQGGGLTQGGARGDAAEHGEHNEAAHSRIRPQALTRDVHQPGEEEIEHDGSGSHAQCTAPADPEVVPSHDVPVDH